MAKTPTLTDITNIDTAVSILNANWDAIQEAFENTLSRDGSTPNYMDDDLDMNSNDILNAKDISVSGTLSVAGQDINDLLDGLGTGDIYNVTNRFNGDGSTKVFTLTRNPVSRANTHVFVNGIYQQKDTYTISGTTLTFTQAPPIGTNNVEIVIQQSTSGVSVTADSVSTSDGQDVQAKIDQAHYPTRTAFVTDITAGKLWAVGDVVTADGFSYKYDGSSTAISDMSGWVPFGDLHVEHFGAVADWSNSTQTGTDSTSAVQDAIDYAESTAYRRINFREGSYRLTSTISVESQGIQLIGSSRLSTQLRIDHSSGPGVRFTRDYPEIAHMAIYPSDSRAAAAKGSNHAVQFECEDIVTTSSMRIKQVWMHDVTISGHPAHGVVCVGPAFTGRIERVISQNNGGHGIVVDSGYASGRTNREGGQGLCNITNCRTSNNGGHGVAIGDPDNTFSTPATRVVVENLESGNNALDSGEYYKFADCFARGANIEFRASIFTDDVASPKREIAGLFIAGRNNHVVDNRFIDLKTAIIVSSYQVLRTSGISIEGMTVLSPTPSNMDPAVLLEVETSADEPSNISVNSINNEGITSKVGFGASISTTSDPIGRIYGLSYMSPSEILVLGSDSVVNNTITLVDIGADLRFWLGANERVIFEAHFEHQSDATADIRFAFDVPSGATCRYAPFGSIKSDATFTIVGNNVITSPNVIIFGSYTSANILSSMKGFVQNGSTEGYLVPKFAQGTATVADTTVFAGLSHMTVKRFAQ